jgi:hypothetical protein
MAFALVCPAGWSGLAVVSLWICISVLTAYAEVTSLYCDSTIMTAGEYNVSCNTSTYSMFVFGCASNGSTSPRVVSINVLTSPTTLMVSDYKDYFPQAVSGALADCVVRITYLAPVRSAIGHPGNVFVVLLSHLRELRVTLLTTLYLGGSFVCVRGVNAPNALIVHISVVAGPQSSILCAGSSTASTTCRVALGAALLLLDRSPPIRKLSIVLNGTDLTAAMWPETSGHNASSFALVMIDTYFAGDIVYPSSHSIVLQDVVGVVVGSRLLALLISRWPGHMVSPRLTHNLTAP